MSTSTLHWPTMPARKSLSRPLALVVAMAIALAACVVSVAIGLLNIAYFDFVNGLIGARDGVVRGAIFSSWLALIGGLVVVWRPSRFGFRRGDMGRQRRLLVGSLVAAALATALVLAVFGTTPYGDASLFIEAVVVPVTEELVFRAVLLTVLLGLYARLFQPRRAVVLAVVVNGIAFGVAHIGNALSMDLGFVLPQVVFASVLGVACAGLMVRTRSVYPAMLLHAVVNMVVVLS